MLMQVGCEQGRLFFHDSEGKIEVSKLRPANLKTQSIKTLCVLRVLEQAPFLPCCPLKDAFADSTPRAAFCCYACGSLLGPAYRHHVISRPWLSRFSQPLQVRIIWLLSYIYSYIIFVGCISERKWILLSFHFSLAAWQVASRPVGNSSAAVPFASWLV